MVEFFSYWWLVICRASSSAYHFFGGWRFFVLPTVIFVIGTGAHWLGILRWPALERIAGKPMNQIVSHVIYGVVAVAVLFVLIWLWKFSCTPLSLNAELKKETTSRIWQLESERDAWQQRHDTLSDLQESSTSQRVQVLDEEVDRLQTELEFKQAKHERLREVRSTFQQHADSAPSEDQWTRDLGRDWLDGTQKMVDATVTSPKSNMFHGFPPNHDYGDLQRSVTSLRTLAINLTIDDLSY